MPEAYWDARVDLFTHERPRFNGSELLFATKRDLAVGNVLLRFNTVFR
jgi:hypothetical protein